MLDHALVIAAAVKLPPEHVAGAVALLKEGATVPFLARYRKERIGELSEEQLYAVKERLGALVSLEARRAVVLSSIKAQDRLDDALRARLEAAASRAEIEDLYLPYCPRPRAPAKVAREQGLEPLAEQILKQEATTGSPEELAMPFLSAEKGVKEAAAALAGARAILADRLATHPAVRAAVRQLYFTVGRLTAQGHPGVTVEKTKYAAYAHFSETLSKLPSHRILAVLRGETEKRLTVVVEAPREKILEILKPHAAVRAESAFAGELTQALEECADRHLKPAVEVEVRHELKHRADQGAAELFARNLRALLLQPPFGDKRVLAAAMERRLGMRLVVLDEHGKVLAHAPLVLDQGDAPRAAARETLHKLIREHKPEAAASGNDADGRAADTFLREALVAEEFKALPRILVNEAGAAAYSVSRAAREEFPELDPPTRAAITIGRRLQNPLAELVKIHPKSVGVGQYQHDVDQKVLLRKLEEAVESCVNRVGVDVNTAGEELLTHVSGLGPRLAASVIETRGRQGAFQTREDLRKVPGFGPKAFELSAGFLRVPPSANPLDRTFVHPERYALVEEMAQSVGAAAKDLLGNAELLAKLDLPRFINAETNAATLRDLVEELKQPGRDPRGPFVKPEFSEGIQDVRDLKEGQVLSGVVTNLTAFGAFVDLGVHQDGLVHVSELSHRFVKDPAQVVTVGQAVKVKVMGVDAERKRISLSLKALEAPPAPRPRPARTARPPRPPRPPRTATAEPTAAASPTPAGGTETAPAGAVPAPGASASAEQASTVASVAPAAPKAAFRGSRGRPEGERREPSRERTAGAPRAGGPRPAGRGDRGPRRPREAAAAPVAPGKPDYSKFFVRSKRKERKEGPRRDNEASREDIRHVLRDQEHKGHTLGDLLKKAGLDEAAPEPPQKP